MGGYQCDGLYLEWVDTNVMGFIWIFPTLQARELLEVALERHPDFAKVNCNNLQMSEDFKFMSVLILLIVISW